MSACPYDTRSELYAAIGEAGGVTHLAKRLGVNDRTVRRWRDGSRGPLGTKAAPYGIPAAEPWGGRRAPVVPSAARKGASEETIIVVGDLHAPYHSEPATDSACQLIEDVGPDRLVLNGDTTDYFAISRHNKNAARLDTLQDEIDVGNGLRAAFRRAAPNALMDETEGNHDSRIRTYVASEAAGLRSLRALDPENLYTWAENGITNRGAAGVRIRPDFLIYHGTRVRAGTGATARAELAAAGISGVSGHTHRLGAGHTRDGYGPRREWWEGGCLCQLEPDYLPGAPDWRHGLLIITLSTRSESFSIQPVSTIDGRFRLANRSY